MRLAWIPLLFVAIGCGKGDFSKQAAGRANELRLVYLTSPATFDPSQSQDVYTNDLMTLVYEGLVGWGEDNRIEPRLAESWDVSKDGRTYTFHLRKAKFSDGTDVTAEDVKWTWERNADSAFNSPLASNYLGDIVGVKDKLAGKATELSGVEVLDPRTLRVTIDQPRPYFLGKLTYPAAYVLAKGRAPSGKKITRIEDMIGSGPFKVVSYDPDLQLKLEPNSNFHDGRAKLDSLKIRIVKDTATRLNLFRQGEIDILSLSQKDVAGIKADPALSKSLRYADRAATIYIGMNGKNYKPFADPRVRRAFVMSIDRQFIIDKILFGVGRKADGILPPTVPQQTRSKPLPAFDPAAARNLIKEAGWKGKLPSIELWVNDADKDRRTIAEFVVTQLREHLGVDAKLRIAEHTTVIQKATRRELGFFYGSWYADYLDAENFLSVLLSDYGQNRTNYENPEFTRICRLADVEGDPARRAELYAQAEDLALQDCPWIPLFFPQEAIVVQPGVSGLRQNAFGFLPPTAVTVKR